MPSIEEFQETHPNTCYDLLEWAELTHRLLERGVGFDVMLEGLRTADSLVRTGEPPPLEPPSAGGEEREDG